LILGLTVANYLILSILIKSFFSGDYIFGKLNFLSKGLAGENFY